MFRVGDKVVHPMHGAGVIHKIESARVSGAVREYYVFKMSMGGLVLKIPVSASDAVGLRSVMPPEAAEKLLGELAEMETDQSGGSWNQRYRENLEKIKSGDLHEVAKVMKTLICRDKERGLSTGERKLLRSAKQILISEMVLVMESDYRNIEDRIHEAVAGGATG